MTVSAFSLPRRLLLLCALSIGISSAPWAHAAKKPWLKLETDEFVVYSDAAEKDVAECAVRYAAYRRTFNEFLVPTGSAMPTTVLIIFRSDQDFKKHVPPNPKSDFNLVNFTTEIDGTPLNSFPVAGDRDRALKMTFEFEAISGLQRLGYHVPVWMSQGTGGIFSAIAVRGDEIEVGDFDGSGGSAYGWSQFFDVGQSSKLYNDPARLADYLVQARGLMHWILFKDDETQKRFARLALRLRSASALDAVAEEMGAKPEGFDREIGRHLRKSRSIKIPFDPKATRASFRISVASEAEVLVNTANLLLAARREFEANANLDRARELAPELAAVKEAWARRMFREGRAADAVQLYREAIAAGSRNFAAYMRSAEGRLNDNRTRGADVAGEGGDAAAVAVDELKKAIQLNPGSAEAYQLLGRAYFVSPRLTQADLADLSNGVFLGEGGLPVRIYRAALFSRVGLLDEAMDDLRIVLASDDASNSLRNTAQRQLAETLFKRDAKLVSARVEAHDLAGAHEILEVAQRSPECEPAKREYDRLVKWLAENEAWAEIAQLEKAKKWPQLAAAAANFVKQYPRSGGAKEARRLVQLAAQQQAASPATAATPASP